MDIAVGPDLLSSSFASWRRRYEPEINSDNIMIMLNQINTRNIPLTLYIRKVMDGKNEEGMSIYQMKAKNNDEKTEAIKKPVTPTRPAVARKSANISFALISNRLELLEKQSPRILTVCSNIYIERDHYIKEGMKRSIL